MLTRDRLSFLFIPVLGFLLALYAELPARPARAMSTHGMVGIAGPVALSADGRTALSASAQSVKVWDIDTARLRRTMQADGKVYAVALSPDARRAAYGGAGKAISIFDVATGQNLLALQGHADAINAIAFSPDGTHVLSASEDSTIKFWDADNGALVETFNEPNNPARTLAFSPDGRRFLSGSEAARLWEIGAGQPVSTFEAEGDPVYAVTFSADGKLALSGGHICDLTLWNVETGKAVHDIEHNGKVFHCRVSSVAFLPNGRRVLSGGWTEMISTGDVEVDNTIKLWDVQTERLLRTFAGHRNGVVAMALTANGKRLVSGSFDGTVKTWDVASGRLLADLRVAPPRAF